MRIVRKFFLGLTLALGACGGVSRPTTTDSTMQNGPSGLPDNSGGVNNSGDAAGGNPAGAGSGNGASSGTDSQDSGSGGGNTTAGDGSSDRPVEPPAPAVSNWRDPVPQPPPPANMPPANSPLFFSAAASELAYSQGRGLDQASNPDYIAKTAPLIPDFLRKTNYGREYNEHPLLHDPYIGAWGQQRGRILDAVITNRYGAHLNVRLYGPKLPFRDPVTGQLSNGPFPVVMFIPGFTLEEANSPNDYFNGYENSLEQLAEHGYIVYAVSPQGQGGSEQFEPPSPYCDPDGAWKQPQEFGMTEQGDCAGQSGPPTDYAGKYGSLYNHVATLPLGGILAAHAQAHLEEDAYGEDTVPLYDSFRPRFVFPALDAPAWLTSAANPWRAQMDLDRLGIVGHSAGADAAVVAGNGDRLHRFKAAVAWDTHGLPPNGVPASVPTLFVRSQLQSFVGPYTSPPHDEYWPAYRASQHLIALGIPMMSVVLRGSNHMECAYIPYEAIFPPLSTPFNVSSKGGVVNLYFTLAWFDRWLKGASTSHPRGDEATQIASARARLLARTFDDSVDRTAQGQGTYGGPLRGNQPYKISGEAVADHLTFFLHSQVAFDGVNCADWQWGCN